jgi:RecB family exonuclease
MSIVKKYFLDWSGHPLLTVAGHFYLKNSSLNTQSQILDLSDWLIVLPGSRANFYLLEKITKRCEEDKIAFLPPRLITPGELPEFFYQPQFELASNLDKSLAWKRAEEIFKKNSQHSQRLLPFNNLDKIAIRFFDQLLISGLEPENALKILVDQNGFVSEEIWRGLIELRAIYLKILSQHQLCDRDQARLTLLSDRDALQESKLAFLKIAIVGCVDLPQITREIIKKVSSELRSLTLEVLILCNESLSENFDDLGCLIAEKWQKPYHLAKDNAIFYATTPQKLVDQLVTQVREAHQKKARISLTVTEDSLLTRIKSKLNLSSHIASGEVLAESQIYAVLKALKQYKDDKSYTSFLKLFRMPLLHKYLESFLIAQEVCEKDELLKIYPELLRFNLEHYPQSLPIEWLSASASNLRDRVCLELYKLSQKSLLEQFSALLRFITEEENLVEFLDKFLKEFSVSKLKPTAFALDYSLLDHLSQATLVKMREKDDVDILGWLELVFDPADELYLASFSEGLIPSGVKYESLLNQSTRKLLALPCDEERHARDCYIFSLINAGERKVTYGLYKFNSEEELVLPSRFLLEGDIQGRLRRYFVQDENLQNQRCQNIGKNRQPWSEVALSRINKQLKEICAKKNSISPSELKDYFLCPTYYLFNRIFKISKKDWQPVELEPDIYGNIAHKFFEELTKNNEIYSFDKNVRSKMIKDLYQAVLNKFLAQTKSLSIDLQSQLLFLRLERASEILFSRRKEGWRVLESEKEIVYPFSSSKGEFLLKARVDQIEINEKEKKIEVIDFKVRENFTILNERDDVDIQLALYQKLVTTIPSTQSYFSEGENFQIDVNYFAVTKDLSKINVVKASLSTERVEYLWQRVPEAFWQIKERSFKPNRDAKWPSLRIYQEHFSLMAEKLQEKIAGVIDETIYV